MKKDGIGGSNTATGICFQKLARNKIREALKTSLPDLIANATFCENGHFYEFIGEKYHLQNDWWNEYISRKILPDDALYVTSSNTMFIFEYKCQKGGGSTDKKILTCAFEKSQYEKLLHPFDIKKVEYILILNKWFNPRYNPIYKDYINYIIQCKCHYFFPLDEDLEKLEPTEFQKLLKLISTSCLEP